MLPFYDTLNPEKAFLIEVPEDACILALVPPEKAVST